jgi:hypothetical protein
MRVTDFHSDKPPVLSIVCSKPLQDRDSMNKEAHVEQGRNVALNADSKSTCC